MSNTNELESIDSVCTTARELIESEKFMRGVKIILKKVKTFNEDYILSLFTKLQNIEDLNDEERGDLVTFTSNEKVAALGQELLSKLRKVPVTAKTKDTDELKSFSKLLDSIFAEDGFKKVQSCIGEVANITELTLNKSEGMKELTEFITSNREYLLEKYKKEGNVTTNGATLPVKLKEDEKRDLSLLNPSNLEIKGTKEVEIRGESISVTEVLIEATLFSLIQVPKFLKGKQLGKTYMGKQLVANSDLPDSSLDQVIDIPYIGYAKENAKDDSGNHKVNISVYNPDASTDAVKECLKKGFYTSNIVYEVILGELIKEYLGEDYVNYIGYKADKNESGHEEKIEDLDEIERVFGIIFNNHADNGRLIIDYGVYENSDRRINGFIRGSDANHGAVGGAVSLGLCWPADNSSNHYLSFRPSI